MKDNEAFKRNLPSDEGHANDPHRREESGQQPGVSTYNRSDNDQENQNKTATASDNFREEAFGADADTRFDEVPAKD